MKRTILLFEFGFILMNDTSKTIRAARVWGFGGDFKKMPMSKLGKYVHIVELLFSIFNTFRAARAWGRCKKNVHFQSRQTRSHGRINSASAKRLRAARFRTDVEIFKTIFLGCDLDDAHIGSERVSSRAPRYSKRHFWGAISTKR